MPPEVVFLNGSFVPYEQAVVPVEDRGFLFADAIYEVIRCYGGRFFRLDDHLERLEQSAAALDIPLPYDRARWAALLDELIRRNGVRDGSVYVQVSRGVAPRSHAWPQGLQPTVVAIARPGGTPPAEAVERGVKAITVPDNRWGLCWVKTTGLLPNVLAKQQAARAGAYEALFVRDGLLTEGTSSNVFVVLDGVLYTHPLANILPGVTRAVVLDVARQAGLAVREQAIPAGWLERAEEVILSGTNSEVLAVVEVDGRPVGGGRPGPVFARLREGYLARVAAETGAAVQPGPGA
ncbi:D-amino-acid transaminase [Thermaerobacter sp. PB12/4term]|uniref:D-amino-acid transaminase n=1 Tax=Thermaerobacter sp. PB12/4term TaxID=2293838 RepID=UPI000E32C2AE|nr:D-amino-acid transaminase [Thermaerobacter sp. PB12/4term]QIA26352.1 D-amino-acid transaminase [Thermaerobacter sp. PB12/4term]